MTAPNQKPTTIPRWASTASTVLPWQASTAYLAEDLATNNGNVYEVVTGGTSAGAGGPAGTSGAIVDGTVTWRYLGQAGTAGGITEPSSGRKDNGWLAGQKPPHGFFNWLFHTLYTWVLYLDTLLRSFNTWENANVFQGPSAWGATTAYLVGEYVLNGGKVYVCTVAGTSAGAGGPTGTGTGIVDGTVTWDYAALPFDVAVPALTRVGLEATQSTTNGAGVTATGNGTGAGVVGIGGETGPGVTGTGGATSGAGGSFTASAGNSPGVTAIGNGTGSGGTFTGGVTNGPGVSATGGGGNSPGIIALGVGVGSGISATGGASSGATGVTGIGGATNGRGVSGTGTGTGAGGAFTSPANGVEGATTSSTTGKGVSGSATLGTGTCGVYAEHQGNGAALIAASSQGTAGEFTRGSGRGAINIVPVAGDPSSPGDGDVWYNLTTHELKIRVNGVTRIFTVT